MSGNALNLSNWLLRHAQTAVGALGTLARNPVATSLTVGVIGIALALPAGLGVLVQSGRALAGAGRRSGIFRVPNPRGASGAGRGPG